MTVETQPAEVVSAPKVKTTADVLRHAAWIIEERGWCQVDWERADGAHCIVGAIIAASSDAYASLGVAAHRALMDRGTGIGWNDTPGRTAAEVTTALRAAADASERAS